LVDRGCKRFLGRFVGEIEVADDPDQCGNDPAPVGTIDCVNGGRRVGKHAGILEFSLWECRFTPASFDSLMEVVVMKYMLLVYLAEAAMDEAARAQCYQESAHLCQDLAASGNYVGAAPLHP